MCWQDKEIDGGGGMWRRRTGAGAAARLKKSSTEHERGQAGTAGRGDTTALQGYTPADLQIADTRGSNSQEYIAIQLYIIHNDQYTSYYTSFSI